MEKEQEYEFKFDIPTDVSGKQVIEAVSRLVTAMNKKYRFWDNSYIFTYYDDEARTLLQEGSTLRSIYGRARKLPFDFKRGAVNTPERTEENFCEAEFNCANSMHNLTGLVRAELDIVASVCTQHKKWQLTLNDLVIEISFDSIFYDEQRTQLLLQELEIELEKGDEEAFTLIAASLYQGLKDELRLSVSTMQKYERVMTERCPIDTLMTVMSHAFAAHNDNPVQPRKAFRKHDKVIPYGIHPCWAAMTLLHETSLDLGTRWNGALALLLHDVLEDTTAGLPEGTSKVVAELVDEMTFDSYGAELDSWWKISDLAKLLKLYDKVSNLMDGAWMPDEKKKMYVFYTLRLVEAVEASYPDDLNIVKIARALCQ